MKSTKRCPIDFEVTEQMRIWAEEKVPGVDIDYQMEKFHDCTFKVAKKDWPATFRNWMRGEQEKIDVRMNNRDFYAGKIQKPVTIEQTRKRIDIIAEGCGLPPGLPEKDVMAANQRRIDGLLN